ncbi:MAG: glycosyltransferase [Gaiellaceae bacterium MAG52_C11]|nr:glycosyltransferase [Candidatus Gaiellasilicea maunaloa]
MLQFVTMLAFGGAERLASDLSIALTERGAEVVVATDTGKTRGFGRTLAEAGVPIEHVTLPRARPLSILRSARELARIIRRHEPQVLHAHNPAAGTVATLARLLSGRRSLAIVTTYHGVRPHRLGLASRVLRGGELVIAVGPTAEQQLLASVPAHRVVQVKNGVPVLKSRTREAIRAEFGSTEVPLIVAVGRYAVEKDHALLVDALAALAGRGRRFRALIVGFGRLEQELKARVHGHGLDEQITITGARTDAVELIGAADILAHTAVREGLPLVLLEAMALGVPVVAVAATGVSDLVQDGVTGFLVPERSPEAIAAALERVLADEALRTQLGEAGKAFVVEHHSFDRMLDEHLDVYDRALALRPSA